MIKEHLKTIHPDAIGTITGYNDIMRAKISQGLFKDSAGSGFRLKDIYAQRYMQIMKAVAEGDMQSLGKVCEGNLYREFSASMTQMNTDSQYNLSLLNAAPEILEIDYHNDDGEQENETYYKEIAHIVDERFPSIEVINLIQTFGAYINAE